MTEEVRELALCEVAHVLLVPGELYRFYVQDTCKECEDLAVAAVNA